MLIALDQGEPHHFSDKPGNWKSATKEVKTVVLDHHEARSPRTKEGYIAPNGKKLIEKKGIEVGNIFQLGFHYSSRMAGAEFTNEKGEKQQYYMGCYGIGLARTLATIVEKYNDGKGIMWPEAVAPYQVHLISIQNSESRIQNFAEEVYKKLEQQSIEVLYDDREVGAGEKFADADLIGIPVRLVISAKTGDKVEWKKRSEKETELVTFEEVLERLGKK
jgi:prolyl-tRNA synthetase